MPILEFWEGLEKNDLNGPTSTMEISVLRLPNGDLRPPIHIETVDFEQDNTYITLTPDDARQVIKTLLTALMEVEAATLEDQSENNS